jgi:hypothetical protein
VTDERKQRVIWWFRVLTKKFGTQLVQEMDRAVERTVERMLRLRRPTTVEELVANGWMIAIPRDDLSDEIDRMFGSKREIAFEDFVEDFFDFCRHAVKDFVSPDEVDWARITSATWAYRMKPESTNELQELCIHAYPSSDGSVEMFIVPTDAFDPDEIAETVATAIDPRFWECVRKALDLLHVDYDREAVERVIRRSKVQAAEARSSA